MLCLPGALHLPAGANPSAQPRCKARGISVGSPPGRTRSYPCSLQGTASSSVPVSNPTSKPLQHSRVCFRSSTSRTRRNYLPYCSVSRSFLSPASRILTSAWSSALGSTSLAHVGPFLTCPRAATLHPRPCQNYSPSAPPPCRETQEQFGSELSGPRPLPSPFLPFPRTP